MNQNKGAVLTGVILMVLVMTLIGVPLLGMVVYNYRLRELDNSLRRAEYENEMAMDKISVIVRNTVMNAIEYAKSNASESVNKVAELQKNAYSELYNKYSEEWTNYRNDYLSTKPSSVLETGIRVGTVVQEIAQQAYIESKIKEYISGDETLGEVSLGENVSLDINSVIDESTGQINSAKLNSAYNIVFANLYQTYIVENISDALKIKSEYLGIMDSEDEILFNGDSVGSLKRYLKIITPVFTYNVATEAWVNSKLDVNVSTGFKKDENTPPTTLSATFVISTPSFDSVASVTQESITLSNAILNQGGLIAGGKLTVSEDTTLKTGVDITVLGGDDTNDTAIELKSGANLTSEISDNVNSESRIATNKDILLNDGSSLTSGSNPIYYRNLYLGSVTGVADGSNGINVNFIGDAVAEDDLEINYNGAVNVNQSSGANYYGFNDRNNKGPDSSSAIVCNSTIVNNKALSLGNLYLAGRAFIDKVKGINEVMSDLGVKIKVVRNYKTGESIAVKGNYLAYQSPITSDDRFLPYKMLFSTYFVEQDTIGFSALNLVDNFIVTPNGETTISQEDFDTNYKKQYFVEFAKQNSGIIKVLPVSSSNIKYMVGAGFYKNGSNYEVAEATGGIIDQSFTVNLANEYEKYTTYFGYRPVDASGSPTSDAKSKIFGANGWIKLLGFSDRGLVGNYYQVYKTGDYSLTLEDGDSKTGIIVSKGDITINVTGTASFGGLIVAGGNITVTGGTLTLNNNKDGVINTIIGNYLGNNTDITGETGNLYNAFTYDNSGTTYVITEIGDSYININDLIGITNWKKSRYGRL